MNEKKTTTLVVIPYAPGKAQGWELKTSVHGWRMYFQGDAHIVTIGESSDMVNRLLDEGALSVHIERPVPENTRLHPRELEFTAIARYIIERYGKTLGFQGFIKTDDDIYPVNSFSLQDVKRLKWIGCELAGSPDSPNHFVRAMHNTRMALEAAGLPTLNYCSHAPRWYDMKKLATVLDRFDCDTVPHLVEPLYFNHWYKPAAVKVNVNLPGNPLKFSCGVPFDTERMASAISNGVKWVNNTVDNYDIRIIRAIEKHFYEDGNA